MIVTIVTSWHQNSWLTRSRILARCAPDLDKGSVPIGGETRSRAWRWPWPFHAWHNFRLHWTPVVVGVNRGWTIYSNYQPIISTTNHLFHYHLPSSTINLPEIAPFINHTSTMNWKLIDPNHWLTIKLTIINHEFTRNSPELAISQPWISLQWPIDHWSPSNFSLVGYDLLLTITNAYNPYIDVNLTHIITIKPPWLIPMDTSHSLAVGCEVSSWPRQVWGCQSWMNQLGRWFNAGEMVVKYGGEVVVQWWFNDGFFHGGEMMVKWWFIIVFIRDVHCNRPISHSLTTI